MVHHQPAGRLSRHLSLHRSCTFFFLSKGKRRGGVTRLHFFIFGDKDTSPYYFFLFPKGWTESHTHTNTERERERDHSSQLYKIKEQMKKTTYINSNSKPKHGSYSVMITIVNKVNVLVEFRIEKIVMVVIFLAYVVSKHLLFFLFIYLFFLKKLSV